MFAKTTFVLLMCSVFSCESAFLDTLGKCSISDGECQKSLLQSVIRDIGKTGIPEYGIPPIDPFAIKDLTITILDLVNITLVEGVAKGAKDCVIDRMETHVEDEMATLEMTCDLTIKGRYKAYGSSPLIQNVLGGATVHGDGKGKVVIDKMRMKFDFHFLVKQRDGDIYLDCQIEDVKYSYTLGKVTFAANNIYLGESDASTLVVGLLNDNWKFIMQSFGKPFLDKAMDIVYEQTHKFFDVVPTKYYLTDDLTPYISKD